MKEFLESVLTGLFTNTEEEIHKEYNRYITRHRKSLIAIAYMTLQCWHEAEDVVQEAVEKFWSLINEPGRSIHHPYPYLAKMVSNACLARLKEKARSEKAETIYQQRYNTEEGISPLTDPSENAELLISPIKKIKAGLSDKERLLFELRYEQKRKNTEIATIIREKPQHRSETITTLEEKDFENTSWHR